MGAWKSRVLIMMAGSVSLTAACTHPHQQPDVSAVMAQSSVPAQTEAPVVAANHPSPSMESGGGESHLELTSAEVPVPEFAAPAAEAAAQVMAVGPIAPPPALDAQVTVPQEQPAPEPVHAVPPPPPAPVAVHIAPPPPSAPTPVRVVQQSQQQPAAPPPPPVPAAWPPSAQPSSVPTVAPNSCYAQMGSPRSVDPWNADGPRTVGLQAGHWLTWEAPAELSRLRSQTGSSGGGYTEWGVNLLIARATAALLNEVGVHAEVLPTTLPTCYRAHAFVSIHGDGDVTGALNGFKVARGRNSLIPGTDDGLVAALNQQYAAATGLPRRDTQISGRMLNYYAFNYRRQSHAISPSTPSAIIETGFITNASDLAFLTQRTDRVAAGIANGVLQFLGMGERVGVP